MHAVCAQHISIDQKDAFKRQNSKSFKQFDSFIFQYLFWKSILLYFQTMREDFWSVGVLTSILKSQISGELSAKIMLLLLWPPTPISHNDLGCTINSFLSPSHQQPEIVIWYADVVCRVLQAEANTSAKLPITAIDLCRSSNYTGCHGFWEHAKVKYRRIPQRVAAKKSKPLLPLSSSAEITAPKEIDPCRAAKSHLA